MTKSRKRSSKEKAASERELRRYVFLLAIPCLVVLLVIAVMVAGGLRDRGKSEADTSRPGSREAALRTPVNQEMPVIEPDTKQYIQDFGGSILSQDAVPEINQLMEQYFLSISECDMPTFLHLFTSQDTGSEEQFRQEFTQQNQYVDGYQNISCYTAGGLTEDAYVVYVSYEIRYKGVETPAPSLVRIYAVRGEDGRYRIYDEEISQELEEFLDRISANEDVRLLISQIDRKLEEAAAADPALKERVDYMKKGPDYMQE